MRPTSSTISSTRCLPTPIRIAPRVSTSRPVRPACWAEASSRRPTWRPGFGRAAYGLPSTVAPARGRGGEAGHDAHRGRLAGTVGSEEAGDESRLDLERDVVDGRERAVALGESLHCDHGLHRVGALGCRTSVTRLIPTPKPGAATLTRFRVRAQGRCPRGWESRPWSYAVPPRPRQAPPTYRNNSAGADQPRPTTPADRNNSARADQPRPNHPRRPQQLRPGGPTAPEPPPPDRNKLRPGRGFRRVAAKAVDAGRRGPLRSPPCGSPDASSPPAADLSTTVRRHPRGPADHQGPLMSCTLTLSGVDVAFGARTLFSGLDLTLADGDVTAVVGPNGSGKSTLMRTIVGELPVEAGSIRLAPRDATIGWLPQVVPDPSETLLTYARRRTGVTAADVELEAASAAIAAGDEGSEDRYATALERWLALGAADLDERLPEVAARVGLHVAADRPLGTLSGGQAARACLVAVLLSQYDVLLLDEPTNDLDARGLTLMADFVPGPRGADPHREPRPHLPRRGDDERRRARRQAAAHRPLHRRLELVRRATPARPRARVGGLRGVCRRARLAARAVPATPRLGRQGPAQRRPRQGARQAHPREAQGPGGPPGREGRPPRAGRRPTRHRGAAAQGVAAALRHHRGPPVRRRRGDPVGRGRRAARLPARPGQPHGRTRRPHRRRRRQRLGQDDPARCAAR